MDGTEPTQERGDDGTGRELPIEPVPSNPWPTEVDFEAEEADWRRLTMEQFAKGYDDEERGLTSEGENTMEIPVLIEPVAENGYRATAFSLTVEGTTEEEALRKMRSLISQRLAGGAKVVPIQVEATPPWMKFVGTWAADDPEIEEWKRHVEEYRRQKDKDLDAP